MALELFSERQQLLLRTLLVHREGRTVEELAEALGVARTAVNQHLRSLEKEDFVARGQRRIARGRPSRLYLLTSKGIDLFPKHYSWFASIILGRLQKEWGTSKVESGLESIAGEVAQSLLPRVSGTKPKDRIHQIACIMKELGYEAVCRADDSKALPVIEAHNCVYHSLALEHPEVCGFDRSLLRTLSGAAVEQESCMAQGGNCCRFRFKKDS